MVDLSDRIRSLWSDGRADCLGVIFYYHAVPAASRAGFARQLDWLARHTTFWALGGPLPDARRWVGLSFDDAYVSVWENAVPELVERGIPFTVFVPTGSLGTRPGWVQQPHHPFWHERVMSAQHIRTLAGVPGVTVGSHTVTHPRLSRLSLSAAHRELVESKAALEDLIGQPVELLSFPHGDWNQAVIELALEAGYRRLFGIEPRCYRTREVPSFMGRVALEPWDPLLVLRLKSRGAYRWSVRGFRAPCIRA